MSPTDLVSNICHQRRCNQFLAGQQPLKIVLEESHICDHHADCIDLDGKYDCKCHIGYAGNGFECINIDECVTSTFLCPTNSGEI